MANTYTWSITRILVYLEYQGLTNVVYEASWQLSATDGTFESFISVTTAIPFDPEHVFVDYASLTQDEVVGWIQAALGPNEIAAAQTACDNMIQIQVNATIPQPPSDSADIPLPWV
jgi:hypothetical protein